MLKLVSFQQLLSWFYGNIYVCNSIVYSDVQPQADRCTDYHYNVAQFRIRHAEAFVRTQRESVAWQTIRQSCRSQMITILFSCLSLSLFLFRSLSLSLSLYIYIYIYRVSQEEGARLRESVPYVELYRYNPKHLYPKLNGYGDNGQRFETLTAVTHLLITKYILKLAGICGFCNVNICT